MRQEIMVSLPPKDLPSISSLELLKQISMQEFLSDCLQNLTPEQYSARAELNISSRGEICFSLILTPLDSV